MRGMKICRCCKVDKPLSDYHNVKTMADGVHHTCKECRKRQSRCHYLKHRDRIIVKMSEYSKDNKEQELIRKRRYYREDKNGMKNKIKEDRRKKYASDPLFRLTDLTRCAIRRAFADTKIIKSARSSDLLGADKIVIRAWLESQFEAGMTWANQGLWHIDHIVPLASASNGSDIVKLCHYTNLQPLWGEDNRKKKAKYRSPDGTLVSAYRHKLKKVA